MLDKIKGMYHHGTFWFLFSSLFLLCFFKTGFLRVGLEPVLKLALIEQAGLEFRDPTTSAYHVLGLKAHATIAQFTDIFMSDIYTVWLF